MRKKFLAVLPAVAALGVLTASPASADEIETFKNVATGKCLDAQVIDGGAWRVYVNDCNSGDNQKWIVHVWNDGTRQLGNKAVQGLCLGVDPQSGSVGAWGCNSEPNNSWFVDNNGRGVRFWNQHAKIYNWAEQCFDTNGTDIYMHGCNDGDNQRWV
ncbi:RICIN domain-containing protein [Streptomyces sp. A1-5]|uniref:RICIN domain-containing protein n=1 Tax=Streptomyces sp. A1-5 TaxID=2738410 RepID=UPI001F34AC04|nr:RICIN domain-containing protein [Streptomyces sp. A1-5]UJB46242.1 ricin-type beta-trefoil lectin domain protein [Streptomyces sp. A1-5]